MFISRQCIFPSCLIELIYVILVHKSMKLSELFKTLCEFPSDSPLADIEVTGIFNDARKVTPGSAFVAIPGSVVDGHKFIVEAIQAGAVALVVSDKSFIPDGFAGFVLYADNTREALDLLAARFYDHPADSLFCIGVTGTNGKTSVTYMIEHIFQAMDVPIGVIGTVNHHLGSQVWPSDMTTPDPLFLQKRLSEFKEHGAKAVAMEVSSHALSQNRVTSVPFNAVIFTNLTRDHLDYHQTMENYAEAKQRLFREQLYLTNKFPCFAIINIADKWGRRLKIADNAVLWTYGAQDADLRYSISEMDFALTKFEVTTPMGKGEVELPMSGEHNVLNALAAIGAGLSAGIPLEKCIQALKSFSGVPGRLQAVQNEKGLSVFVDYAHTPDALENVLTSLQTVRKNLKSDAQIWTIFGCGGDRDKGKRPEMAKIACDYSDKVVITSDNPRTEDPLEIIKDIEKGVPAEAQARTQVVVERSAAIRQTLEAMQTGDVLIIAGKGHEDYQIIGTQKLPFSDFAVAEDALKERS